MEAHTQKRKTYPEALGLHLGSIQRPVWKINFSQDDGSK